MNGKPYTFSGRMWRYSSENTSWYFVYLEEALSEEIKNLVKEKKIRTKGFSFVPVQVTVGKSTWKTTLFPNKKGPYLLSLSKKVRNQEELDEDDLVTVKFRILS